jgi:hypothetical protein
MEYTFKQREFAQTSVFVRKNTDELYELVSTFREFLLACGFHINSVNEYVPDPFEAGEIELDEEEPTL